MDDSTESKSTDDAELVYNPARYWDYILGGYYNFQMDRQVGDRVLQAVPDVRLGALANRSFLRRVVRLLAHEGITQFVDLGSGLPTVGPVHETAQAINPGCHTVYVDNDPVAVTHSQSILAQNPGTCVIEEDIRNIQEIFDDPCLRKLVDIRQPVGVLLVSVLHFIKDDSQADEILRQVRSRMASGSYLVISHYSLEGASDITIQRLSHISSSTHDPTKPRSSVEIARFFDGFELLEPGVVRIPLWRPEGPDELLVEEPERCLGFAGVGRKE
jgi:hypothetical protein